MPWLGTVPSHWQEKRAKHLFREVDERSESGHEELLSVSHKTGVTPRSQKNVTMFKAESYEGHKLCRPDDLVINTMWAWMGALGVSRDIGIVSPAYGVYRPSHRSSLLPKFADLMLRTPEFVSEYICRSTGIRSSRLRLYPESFLRIPLPVPPPDEQAAIVKFLDHADRRIRRYIRAKQKLIKLLEEQKQAIIHQAVTRGLNPNVKLTPSGVEWLGDVPEHWEAVPLKYLARRMQNGATPPSGDRRYYDGGEIPWYGPSSCTRVESVGTSVRCLTELAFAEGKARRIVGPALLVVVIGATAGRMSVMNGDGATNQQITAFEIEATRARALFVAYQLRDSESWLKGTSSTAIIPILDSYVIARLPVALPPVDEQVEILQAVASSLAPVEGTIVRERAQIDLLQEYRTRLISDVVTGKLDVRQAAASLPDELSGDDEPLEVAEEDLDEDAEEATDEGDG